MSAAGFSGPPPAATIPAALALAGAGLDSGFLAGAGLDSGFLAGVGLPADTVLLRLLKSAMARSM